jgi:RNA polymerase sigma factor (sigma-70 family)
MNQVAQQIFRLAFQWDGGDLTDAQLLEHFLSRLEERSFEALVHRHGPMVMGVCRRILGNREDAEDAFQATFLVLARKARSIKPRSMVGNWLHGVAYRTAMKSKVMRARMIARERRAREMIQPDARDEQIWEQLAPLLDKELNGLPENYRSAIVLCDLEGMSRKEAARKLGWSEGTLSGRLARARALLARRLSRYGLSISGGALAVLLSEQTATACLSSTVVASTTKAAMATGQSTLAGLVSSNVLSLTNGALKAMLLTKLKITTLALLGVAVFGIGINLLPGSAQAQKQEAVNEKQPKVNNEALAELGHAQIEVAEAQVKVAESLMQEAEVAIQIAESDRKLKMARFKLIENLGKGQVSIAQETEERNGVERAENEVLAKRVALKTAEAKVAVARAQVKVVIAQVKLGASQP